MVLPESLEVPPDQPDQAGQVPVRQCGRCGGVGTHYLTCPALKLPPGYRISDSRAERRAR
jgi:hypothetical protein